MRRLVAVCSAALIAAAGCTSARPEPTVTSPTSTSPTPLPAPGPTQTSSVTPAPPRPPVTSAARTSAPPKKTPGPPITVPPPGAPGLDGGGGPGGSRMSTGTGAVALTFDDGPSPEYTPAVLDLLQVNGVKATFCVIGKQVHNHPDLIRRIVAEGHTLCNHSWRHDLSLATRGEAAIRDDLFATNRAIREVVPWAQIGYFRAPGGNFDTTLVGVAASMGMTSIYWQVDTRDWDYLRHSHGKEMSDNVVVSVKEQTRPGSIILAHDNFKPDTVTAFKTLLPWLKQRYTLIALPPDGKLPRS